MATSGSHHPNRVLRSCLVFWVMFKRLWRPLGQFFAQRWPVLLAVAAVAGVIIVLIWNGEHDFLYEHRQPERDADGQDNFWHLTAREFSYWGDFVPGTIPLFFIIWILASWCGKRQWQRAALAVLMGAALAGIAANCFRLTLGRPRPHMQLEPGFYGLQRESGYHGFPSGHAATAFGTAIPLLYVNPPLGVAATGLAAGVGWARMQLERHYPSDILAGSLLGIMFGVALGSRFVRPRRGVFRVKKPHRKPKSSEPASTA